MDWILEDNVVDGLFFCAPLTGRRGGHTPFVQAGAETSDTGAEVWVMLWEYGFVDRLLPAVKSLYSCSEVLCTCRRLGGLENGLPHNLSPMKAVLSEAAGLTVTFLRRI